MNRSHHGSHPLVSRRTAVRAGAPGTARPGDESPRGVARRDAPDGPAGGSAKSCIYIFLSGGLAQHESFDLKPDAPDGIRGEFRPIATRTPGIEICEHLPGLARRSRTGPWSVRSRTRRNDHTLGHYFMLTGRSDADPGFRGDRQPRPTDWPSSPRSSATPSPRESTTCPRRSCSPNGWCTGRAGHPGRLRRPDGPAPRPVLHRGLALWEPVLARGLSGVHVPNQSKKPPRAPTIASTRRPSLTLAPGMTPGRLADAPSCCGKLDRQRGDLEQRRVARSTGIASRRSPCSPRPRSGAPST